MGTVVQIKRTWQMSAIILPCCIKIAFRVICMVFSCMTKCRLYFTNKPRMCHNEGILILRKAEIIFLHIILMTFLDFKIIRTPQLGQKLFGLGYSQSCFISHFFKFPKIWFVKIPTVSTNRSVFWKALMCRSNYDTRNNLDLKSLAIFQNFTSTIPLNWTPYMYFSMISDKNLVWKITIHQLLLKNKDEIYQNYVWYPFTNGTRSQKRLL